MSVVCGTAVKLQKVNNIIYLPTPPQTTAKEEQRPPGRSSQAVIMANKIFYNITNINNTLEHLVRKRTAIGGGGRPPS